MKKAEKEGFEPSRGFIPWHVSSVLVSTTHPLLRVSHYRLRTVSSQMLWIMATNVREVSLHIPLTIKAYIVITAHAWLHSEVLQSGKHILAQ